MARLVAWPIQIQQSARLTPRALLKASSLAAVNQLVLLLTCVLLFHACPPVMAAAMAPELPTASKHEGWRCMQPSDQWSTERCR